MSAGQGDISEKTAFDISDICFESMQSEIKKRGLHIFITETRNINDDDDDDEGDC